MEFRPGLLILTASRPRRRNTAPSRTGGVTRETIGTSLLTEGALPAGRCRLWLGDHPYAVLELAALACPNARFHVRFRR